MLLIVVGLEDSCAREPQISYLLTQEYQLLPGPRHLLLFLFGSLRFWISGGC
uniref:Uncharacterized protein n=1 Tax=Rhizophagus irregularis (strain DAOM 181602 / DAOM 197198 / MUCL 43194) TaxID=747089 RepID=U9TAH8_RHIID